MVIGQKRHSCIKNRLTFGVFVFIIILLYNPPVIRTETPNLEVQKGIEYIKLRLYDKAADTFKSVLSRNPNDINVLYQLANLYKLQDDLDLAIKTSETILTIKQAENKTANSRLYGFTHLLLSEIYCKQSKLDIAEQHAIAAVQSCPKVADTHYRLGYIYTHQAKFDKALSAFRKTLLLKSEFPEVYEWLGLIALMQNKPQDAVLHYKTAIKKKPYIQSAYYNLAKAYRLLGDMKSASEQLKQFQLMKSYYDKRYAIEGVLKENPLDAPLRLKLAELHLAHKHINAAIGTYKALIMLNPEFVQGYDKLGRLYMDINQPQRAIPLFNKVLVLDLNAVEAHVRLGWIYSMQRKYDKAESHLQNAIKKMPKLTLAYHGLAEIYTKRGQIQKAIEIYKKITKIDANDKDAWTALRKLERNK